MRHTELQAEEGWLQAYPPLRGLLDVQVMALAGDVLDQVTGAFLEGPVGHQVGVAVGQPRPWGAGGLRGGAHQVAGHALLAHPLLQSGSA